MTKAVWKFGPLHIDQPMNVMGRPVYADTSDQNKLYVWCEVDPAWATATSDEGVYTKVMFVPTGDRYEGKYLMTAKQYHVGMDMNFFWHLIEVE